LAERRPTDADRATRLWMPPMWVVFLMGITYGGRVAECWTDAPSGRGVCTRDDTAAAHADGRHRVALHGETWPVTDAERERWAWLARPRAREHECALPDAAAVWDGALVLFDRDPSDIAWICGECLRFWDLEQDSCGECARPYAPEWRARTEWAGQSLPDWLPVTEDLRAAGGWCAPTTDL
jgi:RNA polymerase subunit RPABC4/transcription elongation factor Spt4